MTTLDNITPTQEKQILYEAAIAQMEEASNDFLYFLNFVKVQVPPQAGVEEAGVVAFKKWPHLIKLAEQLHKPWTMDKDGIKKEDRQTVDGKARQMLSL